MATSEQRRDQISVPLDPELRERLELVALREHRTIASYVRHVVVKALEQQQAAA
jgi:predicted DNA-binding protein